MPPLDWLATLSPAYADALAVRLVALGADPQMVEDARPMSRRRAAILAAAS